MEDVLALAERVLGAAGMNGHEAEVYVKHRVVTTVQAGTGGELRHVGRAETRGVGIRTIRRGRVGYASTSDVSDDGIRATVARAHDNAGSVEPDPAGARLADPQPALIVDGLCHPALAGMPLTAKAALVLDLARRVTSLDPRVRRIDTAEWRDERASVVVASTRGVKASYERGFADLWCDALGEDDRGAASDYGHWWGRDPQLADPSQIAQEAVTRTTRLLGPLASTSAGALLLLDPAVSAVLLDAIGRGLTGAALGSGRSPFAGRHGEPVGPSWLHVVDDGTCLQAPTSAPFDDEGVPRRCTPLIEAGVLTGVLHSTATAAAADTEQASTGNARRATHRGTPRAAPSTLRLAPIRAADAQLAEAEEMICIQQLSGGGAGVSARTGRISVGGIGYVTRDGEPGGRLATLPLAGTLPAFLAGIISVGEDARVVPDRAVLAPTVLWRYR